MASGGGGFKLPVENSALFLLEGKGFLFIARVVARRIRVCGGDDW